LYWHGCGGAAEPIVYRGVVVALGKYSKFDPKRQGNKGTEVDVRFAFEESVRGEIFVRGAIMFSVQDSQKQVLKVITLTFIYLL
jgi:hypothetical protein